MISATLLLWRGYTSARRWAWPAGISKKYCMGFSENVGGNFDGLSTFSLLKWQFRGIHHFQTNSYQQPPDWLTCWVVNPSIWITIKQVSVLSVQICHETKIWLMIAFKLPLTRNYWLVVYLPLWKIWVRQLGWWHSQYMEKNNPNVPNHQPAIMTRRTHVFSSSTSKFHGSTRFFFVPRKLLWCRPEVSQMSAIWP